MRRFQSGVEQSFLLTGPAGTGKSTIARALGNKGVLYLSPTGKGALALRQRSGVDATTVHRGLYAPPPRTGGKATKIAAQLIAAENATKPDAKLIKRLRDQLHVLRARQGGPLWVVHNEAPVKDASLVVVDECFMLSRQIIDDLHKHARRIVFLGDPHQLPPVAGDCPLSRRRPDAELTEIHRQALENPILRVATAVREGRALPTENMNGAGAYNYMNKKDTVWEQYRAADQIIVAKNATRRRMNVNYRARIGRNGLLSLGERLIFLTNAHEMEIYNGSTGELTLRDGVDDGCYDVNVCLDDGREIPAVPLWDGVLRGLTPKECPRDFLPIDYAYAITCHKAQGSEYGNVLVYDEGFGDRETHRRWLYTACTRPRDALTVVNAR